MTEHERADHAVLEYEKDIEDIKNAMDAVASSIGAHMSESKRELVLGMLDELHDQLLAADERVNAVIPTHRASVPESNRKRKELIDELNMLRSVLFKKRIELTIASAADRASIIASAVMSTVQPEL